MQTDSSPITHNPLLSLPYETALERLGNDYFDSVAAAQFPTHILRFRNDPVLQNVLGVDPERVRDEDFLECFGRFEGREPLLALRYHGYQFGEYNRYLGDGRGFLMGQVRGQDGELYDFGTKGSGRTPYSRGADGRLTLKGGVREVLASETLFRMGVRTSRCMSLIETGESLWRGDEPSPTRSSVMVRFSRSHIRFGTFDRLHAIQRPDLMQKLLDHVIEQYYPHLQQAPDAYAQFYAELVQRTAELVAQWMSVGFCHAVLNTDNMSITGESFDYGPYAFIPTYDLNFTAAYFDYGGRYRYGYQPSICHWNLEMLQAPLSAIIPPSALEDGLKGYEATYHRAYRHHMLQKLGFTESESHPTDDLLATTLSFLQTTQVGYHDFFAELRQRFSELWWSDPGHILSDSSVLAHPHWQPQLNHWRHLYHQVLNQYPITQTPDITQRLQSHNPLTMITRPRIEAIWEPIITEDNWEPFYDLLRAIQV
jgi:serine/tyrosine/threonine adenylyltransferase